MFTTGCISFNGSVWKYLGIYKQLRLCVHEARVHAACTRRKKSIWINVEERTRRWLRESCLRTFCKQRVCSQSRWPLCMWAQTPRRSDSLAISSPASAVGLGQSGIEGWGRGGSFVMLHFLMLSFRQTKFFQVKLGLVGRLTFPN